MSNVMAALNLKIQVAPSVENDEEGKFHNSIPWAMPQTLADACTAPVPCSNAAKTWERKT